MLGQKFKWETISIQYGMSNIEVGVQLLATEKYCIIGITIYKYTSNIQFFWLSNYNGVGCVLLYNKIQSHLGDHKILIKFNQEKSLTYLKRWIYT